MFSSSRAALPLGDTVLKTRAGSELEAGVRLVRQVGTGSHSVVYLGFTRSGQPCTVKLFRPDMQAHAEREYRVASQFSHPNLARALLATRLGFTPVVVLSWVAGQTLFRRYAQRPAFVHEPRAFARTMHGVLLGLQAMHQLGFLHRDIKSENILVRADGSAALIDYDLSAPLRHRGGAATQVGTPAFRSPEAGRGEQLTPASDLYGVGLLLLWGLHGYLPSAEMLGRPPAPPPGLAQVQEVALCLLQPAPHQRFQTAQAVLEALGVGDGGQGE